MKESKLSIETYSMAIVGGLAIARFGGMDLLGYGIMTIGGITTLGEIIKTFNPYKKLFENLNLKVGDNIPRFIRKGKTPYGYCLTFSLPYGLSTKDFEKNKLEIEQYLNKRIEICYDNYRVFIKVFEKDLPTSPEFQLLEKTKILEFPIGVKYGGELVTVDLGEVVHLLIAGETGSGKSTLLRGIITHLILSNKPLVSLYLIDMKKGTEFNVFKKCKMVKSYSKNVNEAQETLSYLINEVDRRYDLFPEYDVVNIEEYNKIKGIKKLDYKIAIIDEFARLQNEKESISAIEELTAMARACGINLIASTQRPSAKIINGEIKSNMKCVIGLKTLNSLNSRIIIDENGLEELRGNGHGFLKYSNVTEFQSMNLSNQEARDFVKHTYIDKKEKSEKNEIEIKDFGFLDSLK